MLDTHCSKVLLKAVVQDGMEVDGIAAVESVHGAVSLLGRWPPLLPGGVNIVTEPHHERGRGPRHLTPRQLQGSINLEANSCCWDCWAASPEDSW